MTSSRTRKEQAREMREKGATYETIANRLKVSVRTVTRWFNEPGNKTPLAPEQPSIPDDRLWPPWTPAEVQAFTGWSERITEENLSLVDAAEDEGNLFIPWFFRRIVEGLRDAEEKGSAMSRARSDYLFAIAGLPVLAEWANSPSCVTLGNMIATHRPWNSSQAVRSYVAASKGVAEQVKSGIRLKAAQGVLRAAMITNGPSPVLLLNALAKRVPRFDKVPMFSIYRGPAFDVGPMFLGIFLCKPLGGSL